MAEKVRVSLTMDEEIFARGERFAQSRGISLDQLVSDLLTSLALDDEMELTPTVKSLLGAARGSSGREIYRVYLEKKYGIFDADT